MLLLFQAKICASFIERLGCHQTSSNDLFTPTTKDSRGLSHADEGMMASQETSIIGTGQLIATVTKNLMFR